jgi:hypothetical protein
MFFSEREQACVRRCPGGFVQGGLEVVPIDAPETLFGVGRRCADAPGEPGANVPLGPVAKPQGGQPVASKQGVVTLPPVEIKGERPGVVTLPAIAIVEQAPGGGGETSVEASAGKQEPEATVAGIPAKYLFGGLAVVGAVSLFALFSGGEE